MKHYDLYLFDFDYTLADSSKGIVMSFRHVLDFYKHTGISDEAIKHTIGKTLEDAFSSLTGHTDAETLLAYEDGYIKKADSCMTENTVLFPETIQVLNELKKRGAKLGIISTKHRYCIMELIDLKFPKGFFDIVLGGEDVKQPKPSPEGLLFAMETLDVSLENTIYIGDSTIDAETAKAAGTDFVGVLHGTTTREELTTYPHVEIGQDLNILI